MNDNKKSKFHARTEEQIIYGKCLLPFSPASFFVLSAMKERKYQNNYFFPPYERVKFSPQIKGKTQTGGVQDQVAE